MNLDEHVYDLLSGIGDTYPAILPIDSTLPALVYQRVSAQRARSHEGTVLIGALYQIRAIAHTATLARETGREVVDMFEGRLGEAQIENHFETYYPDRKNYAAIVDVRVWAHQEEPVSS